MENNNKVYKFYKFYTMLSSRDKTISQYITMTSEQWRLTR